MPIGRQRLAEKVRIEESLDDESCILRAIWDQRFTVGMLKAIFQDSETARLDDIKVEDSVPVRNSAINPLVRRFCTGFGLASFKQIGIGSDLLRRFLGICDGRGISRIVGHIVEADEQQSPFLRAWYQHHGFRILPPTDTPFPDTVATIEWRLGKLRSEG